MFGMELASGELLGRKVMVISHPSYNNDKARFVGVTAMVVGMKPCGHYELKTEDVYSDIDYYCWNDEMLQPVEYANVSKESLPSDSSKAWYAIVHENEMGDFSIVGTVSCTDETFSTVEAILDMMDDIHYEVMPLNDAAEMLEV